MERAAVKFDQRRAQRVVELAEAACLAVRVVRDRHGEFHHTLGATLVELDGGTFHLRQINALKDGSFIDLDMAYWPDGMVTNAPPALALVMGDTHVDFIDPAVDAATIDMTDVLDPKYLVYHDVLDGYACNPHHKGNPFNAIAKAKTSRGDVRWEIERALDFIRKRGDGRISVVVPSNHNDFLRRWVVSNDWRTDPANAEFYLRVALHMARNTRMGAGGVEYPDPFVFIGREYLKDNPAYVFLERGESFNLAGVELAMHGDAGPNGARGSRKNLARIGVKSVIGHTHSPGIEEGCYQVGTSTNLRLEYTNGPSSWLNTNCVLYANGKRSLLNVINGNWRI
jgi:hypothetical protein